jgi:hypothetical protein
MASVPLDLQKRCEQRWAARFARPAPSAAPKGHQPESQNQQHATPAEAKDATGRVEAAGWLTRDEASARVHGSRPSDRVGRLEWP